MRLLKYSALALAALGSSACYRATAETGRPAGTTVASQTVAFYFWGLTPEREVSVAAQCPRGVSRVETLATFGNGLVSFVTLGIYNPRTVLVTCASGSASLGGRVLEVAAGADAAARRAAITAAAHESQRTGEPVFVRF